MEPSEKTFPVLKFLMEATLVDDYKEMHHILLINDQYAIGIVRILTDICVKNSTAHQKESRDFCGKIGTHPSVSLRTYVITRLLKYMKPSIEILSIALALIDRMLSKNKELLITFENIHRLLSIAITIAIKFSEDSHSTNEYYSRVAGMSIGEFNSLEILFLKYLDSNAWIHEDLIFTYEALICTIIDEPITSIMSITPV